MGKNILITSRTFWHNIDYIYILLLSLWYALFLKINIVDW